MEKSGIFEPIKTITVEIDVNLMLLGLDKNNEEFSTIRDGIIDKLSDRMVQRFLKVNKQTIQEKDGSHIEYKIHYHYINVHPMVQIYISHLMTSVYRDIDINLTNVKVINPYELSSVFNDLFDYVRQHSDLSVPSESDLIFIIMNSQVDVKGRYGFTTEFSYPEEQKMIDEIFKDNSPFAISDFIFPLTEPLTYDEDFNETPSDTSHPFVTTHLQSDLDSAHNETHCVVDWRELSLAWAYERDLALSDPHRVNARNNAQYRITRNLELLRDEYDKKEQKRIILQMKQILSNDYLVNDELVDWIEGTFVVSDYVFIHNFLLFDIGASSFEWGSIHDHSNIRLKSTFVDRLSYASELTYFTSLRECMIHDAQFVSMLVTQSCKTSNQPSCQQDQKTVSEIQSIFETKEITSIIDIQHYYKQLTQMERLYPIQRPLEFSANELDISIRLTQMISDMIAHFVIPPFVLTDSFSLTSHVHTLTDMTRISLDHNHKEVLSSHSYYASFDESKVHSLHSAQAIMDEVERSIHAIPEIKQKIHFQIHYFTHSDYEDVFNIDGSFFDYNGFRSEVEKLKLPSQEFYFSFQEFKLEKEPRLQLALLQSMSSVILPHINNKRGVYPIQQKYINSTMLFSLLKTDDSVVHNNDIQIYIFCMTDSNKKPVFLDKYEQVVAHSENNNHFIFAVQNERLSFSSPYSFNNLPLYYNLHNIMSPMLTRVFELLSSTKLTLYFGEKVHTTVTPLIEDCVFRCIGSVDSFFSANVIYSPFHVEVIRKSDSLIHLQIAIDEFNQLLVPSFTSFDS